MRDHVVQLPAQRKGSSELRPISCRRSLIRWMPVLVDNLPLCFNTFIVNGFFTYCMGISLVIASAPFPAAPKNCLAPASL